MEFFLHGILIYTYIYHAYFLNKINAHGIYYTLLKIYDHREKMNFLICL